MPSKKKAAKTSPSKPKEKHYELLFPDPKGVPAYWFDQYSIEETRFHLIVKTGSSIGDPGFNFALSKSELVKQNFNFGRYIEDLRSFVDDAEVSASKVKRLSASPAEASPIYSVRYIRAGRVGSDGELVLYTFPTVSLLSQGKQTTSKEPLPVEAEAVAILHADLNPHYSMVLELLPYTLEGQS